MTGSESSLERSFSNKAPSIVEEAAYAQNALFDYEVSISDRMTELTGIRDEANREIDAKVAELFEVLKVANPAEISEAEFVEQYRHLILLAGEYRGPKADQFEKMLAYRKRIVPGAYIATQEVTSGKSRVSLEKIAEISEERPYVVFPFVTGRTLGRSATVVDFEFGWKVATEKDIVALHADEVLEEDDNSKPITVVGEDVAGYIDEFLKDHNGSNRRINTPSTLIEIVSYYETLGQSDRAEEVRQDAVDLSVNELERFMMDRVDLYIDDVQTYLAFVEESDKEAYEGVVNRVRLALAEESHPYNYNGYQKMVFELILKEQGYKVGSRFTGNYSEPTVLDRLRMQLRLTEEGQALIDADKQKAAESPNTIGRLALREL